MIDYIENAEVSSPSFPPFSRTRTSNEVHRTRLIAGFLLPLLGQQRHTFREIGAF